MNNLLRQSLIRSYYFAEAMAFYEIYYNTAAKGISDDLIKGKYKHLENESKQDSRPITWVPLVFHCTSIKAFKDIIKDGYIKPGKSNSISLTEIPIGELDRMKTRTGEEALVAIAFPRRYIYTLDVAPVLWTKHNTRLKELISSDEDLKNKLGPFIETDDDLGCFQEIRSLSNIPIEKAVWFLSTDKLRSDGEQVSDSQFIEAKKEFNNKYGYAPCSYWNRDHQMSMLGEWQYIKTKRGLDGRLEDFCFVGEFYWKQECFKHVNKVVKMPAGKDFECKFYTVNDAKFPSYKGPYTFFDVAQYIKQLIISNIGNIDCLDNAFIVD